MVDATKAMESSYINVDLIRESLTKKGVILDEGEFKEQSYGDKKSEKFELTVEIDGKKKTYCPNMDSAKNFGAVWGRDSKAWVGKIIQFTILKKGGRDTINAFPAPVQQ